MRQLGAALLFCGRRLSLLVLVVVAAAIALSIPDQTLEVYRRISEKPDLQQLACGALSVLLCALCAFIAATYALSPSNSGLGPARNAPYFIRLLAAVISALIPAAIGYGLLQASTRSHIEPIPPNLAAYSSSFIQLEDVTILLADASRRMWVYAICAWVLSILILIAPTVRRLGALQHSTLGAGLRLPLFIAIGAFILLTVAFASSTNLAQFLGSAAILNLFISAMIIIAAYISHPDSRAAGFVLLLVCAGAALFAWTDINDDHVVSFADLPEPRKIWDAGGPQRAFESWLTSRADASHYLDENKAYPIFIISARGGGIYATAQVGLFLSRMQDRCPGFSQHVFAISGVSGGSIGAAAFDALSQSLVENADWKPCSFGTQNTGGLESVMREFVSQDYLSPLLSAALFPDLLQRILPWPIAPFDRAKALERALEVGWAKASHSSNNPFTESFIDHWRPTSATPALLINTTEVETGKRNIIAPFDVSTTREQEYSWFYEPPGVPLFYRPQPLDRDDTLLRKDIKLSTAAVLSARFPWLLPAATLERGPNNIHLVDGGYFDNSGVETSLDLIERLRTLQKAYNQAGLPANDIRRNFMIYLVSINGSSASPPPARSGSNEILTPVEALLSSREARGLLTTYRAETMGFFVDAPHTNLPPGYHVLVPAMLDHQDYPLSLGFEISLSAQRIIESQIGLANECGRMNDAQRDLVDKI